MRVDIEEQLFYKAMLYVAPKNQHVHETNVTAAISLGLPNMEIVKRFAPLVSLGLTAMRAGVYLVDSEETFDAMRSARESAGEPSTLVLPPLPFKTIVVECIGGDEAWGFVSPNADGYLDAVMFHEEEQGESWLVGMWHHTESDPPNPMELAMFRLEAKTGLILALQPKGFSREEADWLLTPQRAQKVYGEPGDLVAEWTERFTPDDRFIKEESNATANWWMACEMVELIHLIVAQGVQTQAVTPSRPQKRRAARAGIDRVPTIYTINLGGLTTRPPTGEGPGTREYTCRWLVRGHWRHFQNGDRTWVRPYIKGPAGAPWKGKPVYVAQ